MEGLDRLGPTHMRRLLDAVVNLTRDLDLAVVLEQITETATQLAGASYGALGVLDPTRSHLVEFVTVGITKEQQAVIGELPKGHGILGLLITKPEPIRLPDLTRHPDSYGFPPGHPAMTSFLGVPLFVRGRIFGNLYLTDKVGGEVFTDTDVELVVALASAAAVAIDNARLHARVRELDLIEDRERIARDLHDTVIQRLFATGLVLEGAARFAERPEVQDRLRTAVDDLDQTVREIRTAIFELRAEGAAGRSLRRDLLGIGSELAPVLGSDPRFSFDGPIDTVVDEVLAGHVVAVVREGLANVARHSGSSTAAVSVSVAAGWIEVTVTDQGTGPTDREGSSGASGGNGLDNLRERASDLGGTSDLEPVANGGARLRWRVPLPG